VCAGVCVLCVLWRVEGGSKFERGKGIDDDVAADLSFANAKEKDKDHPTELHNYLRQLHGKQVVCARQAGRLCVGAATYNGLGRETEPKPAEQTQRRRRRMKRQARKANWEMHALGRWRSEPPSTP